MKKVKKTTIVFLVAAIVVCMLCGAGYAQENYMQDMLNAVSDGSEINLRMGAIYEYLRNEKIKQLGLDYELTDYFTTLSSAEEIKSALDEYNNPVPEVIEEEVAAPWYSEYELYLLAKLIHQEAGSDWLPEEWLLCVGEVVMNRVSSPEFPNTITEVIYQSGQYSGHHVDYYTPDATELSIARRVLDGERYINDPSVIFQANFVQGGGVAVSFYDSFLGTTYFCYSSHPEYYR